jgi:hypothetical protein
MAHAPGKRMDPPPRSFAADAHDRIMVQVLRTNRIQGCGAMSRPLARLRLEKVTILRDAVLIRVNP